MKTQSALVWIWVAAETQAGTPLANQTFTLSNCIIDDVRLNPATKGAGSYKVSGHCMAGTADADQLAQVTAG